MAIVPDVPGLQVEIVVDGTTLHEHVNPDEEESGNTVTRYIEAVSGAEFAVQYRFGPEFKAKHAASIHVYVDGECLRRSLINKKKHKNGKNHLITGPRVKEGNGFYVSNFCFAELNIGM